MKNTGKICIVMANMTEDFRDDYVIGIEKQANRLGYNTYVFSMPLLDELHTHTETGIYDLIDFEFYDGVIFFEDSFSAHKGLGKQIEYMIHTKCQKPVVVLGESLLFPETIFENNSIGCELLTDHIIETHGCKLLYFLGGAPGQISQNEQGFIRSLEKHGIPCTDDILIYGGYWLECGENLAKDIAFQTIEKPDAVICQDDTVALFLIKALTKYGFRIPNDILVTGFGARRDSRNNILSITTCSCHGENTGRKAMARLHSLITDEPEPQISVPMYKINTGMSCGCKDTIPANLRLQLELHEKRRLQEIYYHNSQLEEKLYDCSDYKELFPVILHSSYLISDKNFLAISIRQTEDTSRCIYLRSHMWDDKPILYKTKELYPLSISKSTEAHNLHILPITFGEHFLGHIVVGYKEPIIYNNILKRYISRLAITLNRLQYSHPQKQDTASLSEETARQATDASPTIRDTLQKDSVFVQKDGSLHKVSLENVLMFESEERKTMAVLRNGRYEVKKTLGQLEELFSQKGFMRVSKSTLVNLAKVVSVTPDVDRTLIATLTGKITVRVSRKNANEFKEKINII